MNLIITYLAILGGILGSFENMLINRLPKEENIVWKRSYCPSCKHKLGILDLVPIFSYLSVLGKCRYCKKKIPIRYLLVELLNIALILSCFYVYGFSFLFFKTYIFMFGLLIIFFTDLKEQIVPDSISISFIILGLASAIYEKNILDSIYGLIIGFSIFFIIGFIAKLYYKKDALGFGDKNHAFDHIFQLSYWWHYRANTNNFWPKKKNRLHTFWSINNNCLCYYSCLG